MSIIDGRKIAEEIKEKLKKEFEVIKKGSPCLASIIIGKDSSSEIYATSQKKLCDELGVKYQPIEMPEDTSVGKIRSIVEQRNAEQYITGFIVQHPLPPTIDHQRIIEHIIGPEKDVEGLHPENMGRLFSGNCSLAPCTPAAVMETLRHEKIELRGKEVVIIGHSEIVGKPLSIMLLNEFATVTVSHIATSERKLLKEHVKRAEILISAVGKKDFKIPGSWIKEGAIVIDVATKGDVDFESAKKKASYITPVPGGVGPVTNVMLMKNLLELYKRK